MGHGLRGRVYRRSWVECLVETLEAKGQFVGVILGGEVMYVTWFGVGPRLAPVVTADVGKRLVRATLWRPPFQWRRARRFADGLAAETTK